MGISFLNITISLSVISLFLTLIITFSSMQENAKAISLINEISIYREKNLYFKERYNYFAGDFPFAENIWNEADSGNGDNVVDDVSESFRVWKHLEYADLYSYNYIWEDYKSAKVNKNMPLAKNFSCGFQVISDRKLNNSNFYFAKKNIFLRIAKENVKNLSASCISAKQASYIDKKIDDSLPLAGKLFADKGYEKNNLLECVDIANNIYYNESNVVCFMQLNILAN